MQGSNFRGPGSGDSEHLTEEPQIGLLVAAPYQSMASMFRAQVIGYGTARGQIIINYPEYGNDCSLFSLFLCAINESVRMCSQAGVNFCTHKYFEVIGSCNSRRNSRITNAKNAALVQEGAAVLAEMRLIRDESDEHVVAWRNQILQGNNFHH